MSGANKGIGKEIARGLAKQGFTVLLGARKQELGEAAATELAKDGQVHFQQLDVTDVQSVKAAAAAVKQKYGCLDVLVGIHSESRFDIVSTATERQLIFACVLNATRTVKMRGSACSSSCLTVA